MSEKNNLDKYTGILFELKIGLNKDNAIVIDYGGKPVGKVREALTAKYEADIKVAKATINVYMDKSVGIGEHPQFIHEIDKQLEIITNAEEKLETLHKHYPTDDDIPF